MDKQKKTIHALTLPYPEPQWPSVSPDQEQAILRFLVPLLQPIGDFRRDHVPRSKGKTRSGKAKQSLENESMPEWMPQIYDNLTIGFNSTVRRLESLARSHTPPILAPTTDIHPSGSLDANLSVIFVCRKSLPEIMASSLPLLTATSAPKATRAKLVELPPQAEAKLAQALQQPRVGVLGLEEGAPGADTLIRFVLENIDSVEISWLDKSSYPAYFPVKIQTVETARKSKAVAQNRKRKHPSSG